MDLEYIKITFTQDTISQFNKLIKEICKDNDFFYSDYKKSISGNVTSNLHMTIFYGLIDNQIDIDLLKLHLRALDIKALKLGKLFLKSGYQNSYQILGIEVDDTEGKLERISKSFTKFPYDLSVQLPFLPHLTLAYVNNQYKLPKQIKTPSLVTVKKITYSKDNET